MNKANFILVNFLQLLLLTQLGVGAGTKGKLATVLSIDGGGVRGIIPATLLAFLESKLQDDTLTGDAASIDISTLENMQTLEKIGNDLLKRNITRVNLDTGKNEVVQGQGRNEDALFALPNCFQMKESFEHLKPNMHTYGVIWL